MLRETRHELTVEHPLPMVIELAALRGQHGTIVRHPDNPTFRGSGATLRCRLHTARCLSGRVKPTRNAGFFHANDANGGRSMAIVALHHRVSAISLRRIFRRHWRMMAKRHKLSNLKLRQPPACNVKPSHNADPGGCKERWWSARPRPVPQDQARDNGRNGTERIAHQHGPVGE